MSRFHHEQRLNIKNVNKTNFITSALLIFVQMNISLGSIYKLVVFPQGKWNWIFIGYKVCGNSNILAESCCISVNAEVSILSAVLGSSWSAYSLAKECATHPLLVEPEIRTVTTLVMGSWRCKLNTLNLFQSKDHNWNLKFNSSMFCAPCWRPHCTHFQLGNCISFSTCSR